jgi:cytochrome d ubiquinol oxidase subunit I
MDAVLLSRIQFGLTAGFHFLYPPLTLGLTLFIVMLETLHLAKKEDKSDAFLLSVKILASCS